ncbi:DUF4184 family protein [Streptomyces sp. NRRL B-1347]|uniref:DUF4184 family protein n=1 Tax=Streptomyces sp. NRRL B-1347 TaxID=1476877 RepID=UPI0018FE1A60|nr:DUF4184 family protein [Streptomyces sp. NRRL B-1347]
MPFTLSHPAAVLPLLRRPFVPAALVAGAVAPDAPYFLTTVGISARSAQDWYEPLLNATQTHSSVGGLLISLPSALGLVAAYRLLRAPLTALLPSGLRLPEPERTVGLPAKARHTVWLLVSALIGIASHMAWDSFTHGDGYLVTHVEPLRASAIGGLSVARLLQYTSTVIGLAALGRHLWRRRDRLRPRAGTDSVARLSPLTRWGAVVLLVAAPVVGGVTNAARDFTTYRYVTEVDYSRPTTVDLGNGASDTSYPTETVPAPWGTLAEGVLTGVARRACASLAVALVLYCGAWHIGAVSRRAAKASSSRARSTGGARGI